MNYQDFLSYWHETAFILVFVSVGVGIFTYLIYNLRFSAKKSLKEKFDLASNSEIRVFLWVHIFMAIGLFFFNNIQQQETVAINSIWFFIRIFVSTCISVLYAYVAYLILKFYYPGKLEKKLKRLRYTPRINHENGNKMKLLSEEEEDAYLDEAMQAEEGLFSVDYDVWIDESTGYTKIEKYKGHLSALKCDRCGFQTMRLRKEEIIETPSDLQDGRLLKEYNCSYCGRIKRKSVVLTRTMKDGSEASVLIANPLSGNGKIAVVKIELHGINGEVKEYDFQNLNQAKNFLNEFNFNKLDKEVF